MHGRCQEYINVALTIEIYTTFNSKDCLVYQGKFINMSHDLTDAAVLTTSLVLYGHTSLCSVTSFAHNADKQGKMLLIYHANSVMYNKNTQF